MVTIPRRGCSSRARRSRSSTPSAISPGKQARVSITMARDTCPRFRLRLSGQRPFLLGSAPDSREPRPGRRSHQSRYLRRRGGRGAQGRTPPPKDERAVAGDLLHAHHDHQSRAGADPVQHRTGLRQRLPRPVRDSRHASRRSAERSCRCGHTEDGLILGYVGLDGVTRQTDHSGRANARPSSRRSVPRVAESDTESAERHRRYGRLCRSRHSGALRTPSATR